MTMELIKAIDIAIEAIDERQNEHYEGGEREEPGIKEWIEEQQEALQCLVKFKREKE